jgi:NAD(P)H dehydrogenase (quinone)
MPLVSIIYHSGYGHTEVIAKAVAKGVSSEGRGSAKLIKISNEGKIVDQEWQDLANSDAIIFGSPTYMGSVSGAFKMFADSTSKIWYERKWVDKISGGFTNSGGYSGDKLGSLMQIAVLASQHGMIWVGNTLLPTGNGQGDINRLSSYLGVMAQSDNGSPEVTPPEGDIKTAEAYGQRVIDTVLKFKS